MVLVAPLVFRAPSDPAVGPGCFVRPWAAARPLAVRAACCCLWRRWCSGRRLILLWGRAARCARGRRPARSPSAPRVVACGSAGVLGAVGPGRCVCRWAAARPLAVRAASLRLGASSRSPARPRHRPPAPQQIPPAPSTPAAPTVLCGDVSARGPARPRHLPPASEISRVKPASPLLAQGEPRMKPTSPLLAQAQPQLKPPSPLRARNGRFGCVFRLQR